MLTSCIKQRPLLRAASGLRHRRNLKRQAVMSCCAHVSGNLRGDCDSSDVWIDENSLSAVEDIYSTKYSAKGKQKKVETVARFFPNQLALHLSHYLLVEGALIFTLCLEKHEPRGELSCDLLSSLSSLLHGVFALRKLASWWTLNPTDQPTPELHKPGRSNLSSPHTCLTPGLSKDKLTLCLPVVE